MKKVVAVGLLLLAGGFIAALLSGEFLREPSSSHPDIVVSDDESFRCLDAPLGPEYPPPSEGQSFFYKLRQGTATEDEVYGALRDREISRLAFNVSTMTLYRDKPFIVELLKNVWADEREKYPAFSWICLNDPFVRVQLGASLGEMDAESRDVYHDYIFDQLDHVSYVVRSAAAFSLGRVGSNDDIPHLLEMVKSGEHSVVFLTTIEALAALRTAQARQALEKILRDPLLGTEVKRDIKKIIEREFN